MKIYLLIVTTCLIFSGCARDDAQQREMVKQLEAIKSELVKKQSSPVRWAFANKREIDSAIFQLSRDKMEQVKKTEALSPEIEEKIHAYESLQNELTQKKMEAMRLRFSQRPPISDPGANDKEQEALAGKVAEAKAPVAAIIDKRNLQEAQFREQYHTDRLIADYVRDRYELVVDSSDEQYSRSAVLYRTNGEVPDITEGVLAYFRQKAK